MADKPTLPIVTVTGDRPIFGDPFGMDSFGLVDYLGGLSINEEAAARTAAYPGAVDEAFAPPVPVLLPEVIVSPPPKPTPITPAVRVAPGLLTGLGAGLIALLFPTPTAPRELDEAPTPPQKPPPPPIDPVLAEPQLPPNWQDLARGGDERLLDPIRAPGLPIPLPDDIFPDDEMEEVLVTPPPVTTRSPVLPGSAFDFWLTPVGNPYEFPGFDPTFSPDPGPGSTPAPDSTPRVDPAPGDPVFAPLPEPNIRVAPDPFRTPAPDPFSPPLPDIIGNPLGDPIFTPGLPAPTGPSPRTPAAPADPTFFADPLRPTSPDPVSDPFLTEFQPEPLRPNADACQCSKPKKEKKKRKKRDKCFKGTYQQRASGTIFRPTEEIPCDAPLPKRVSKRETDAFGRPVPKKRGKRRTPTWQDTINDVFYPKP